MTAHSPRACGEEPNGKASDKLALSRESVTGPTVRNPPNSVQWQGREYDVDSGVDVLMSVVRDPLQSAEERHRALLGLAMLRRALEGRPCLDELARLCDNPSEPHKGAILICFLGSDDPRGIPVFIRTLDKESNMTLRLSAEVGLRSSLFLLLTSNGCSPHVSELCVAVSACFTVCCGGRGVCGG